MSTAPANYQRTISAPKHSGCIFLSYFSFWSPTQRLYGPSETTFDLPTTKILTNKGQFTGDHIIYTPRMRNVAHASFIALSVQHVRLLLLDPITVYYIHRMRWENGKPRATLFRTPKPNARRQDPSMFDQSKDKYYFMDKIIWNRSVRCLYKVTERRSL